MSNFKLIKTAAALALGASVVTSAVVPTDASAASKYKIVKGKLVIAKTGKVAKGYVTYKSLVYKDGKKLTGLKGKTYYKAGKKATGTYKGAYYYKGAKKITTGTYKGAYYVKGVKKVTTGLYNGRYYKSGVKATGTYKGAYYVKGTKKVTTGVYNGAYYVKGYKKVTTGVYNGAYYVKGVKKVTTGYYAGFHYVAGVKIIDNGFYGKTLYINGKENTGLALFEEKLFDGSALNKEVALFEEKLFDGATLNEGYKLYKEDLYKDEKLNTGKAVVDGKLYEDAKLSTGLVPFTEEGKKELVYNDGVLANGTFTVDGKEVAYEDGIEVTAKVASVEAINGTTIEVKFNKAVDKEDAESAVVKNAIKVGTATISTTSLSEDGRTLTLTASAPLDLKEATVEIPAIKTKADTKVLTPKYVQVLTYKDTVAPTVVSATSAIAKVTDTTTNKVTVKFSEPVQSSAIAYVNDANVQVSQGTNKDELELTLGTAAKVGDVLKIKLTNVKDLTGNTINPNPAEISTTVVAADSVAPVLASVTTKSTTAGLKVTFAYDKKVVAGSIDDNKTYLSANGTKVGTLTAPVVSNDGKSVSYTATLIDPAAAAAFAKDGKYAATLYVQEALVTDEAGNKSAASNQSITFDKDVVAPTLISSEFKENKLVLNFDEAVTVEAAKKAVKVIGYNAQTGYEDTTIADADLTAAVSSNDGKTLTVDLGVTAGVTDKLYKVSFVKGALIDASGNEVAAYNETITVKKAETTEAKDTVAPKATLTSTAAVLNGSNYVLTYTVQDLKGLATDEAESGLDFASILNVGNYTLAGKALPTGSKISTNVADTATFAKNGLATVTITIPKASVTTSLTGPLTVTGIKDIKGNTSTAIEASANLTLAEGVAPTLSTATAVDNTIILGFSEAMSAVKGSDFKVTVNNKEVTAPTEVLTKITTGSDKGKYYLNLDSIVSTQAAVSAKAAGFYDTSGTALALPASPSAGDTVTVGTTVYTYAAAAGATPAGFYDASGTALVLPTSGTVGDKVLVGTIEYTYAAAVAEEASYKYVTLDGNKVKLSKDTLAASSEITSIKVTTVDAPADSKDSNNNVLTGKTVITVK